MANIDSVKLPNGNEYNLQDVVTPRVEASNRNLLDNPWFTVNQRGFSSSTFSQLTNFIDRWQGNKVISLSANGLTLTPSGGDVALRQTYPSEDTANMLNKTYTASAMLSDGTILSGTADIGNLDSMITLFNDAENSGARCVILKNSSNQIIVQYASTKTVTIKAVKLELGTISTLALDTAPDYTTELLKCQRYYYRINALANNAYFALGYTATTTGGNIIIYLPVPMRDTPTLNYIGTIKVTGSASTVTTLSLLYRSSQSVCIAFASTSLTVGQCVMLYFTTSGDYLELSAEL